MNDIVLGFDKQKHVVTPSSKCALTYVINLTLQILQFEENVVVTVMNIHTQLLVIVQWIVLPRVPDAL